MTDDESVQDQLRRQYGLETETVADILGDAPAPAAPAFVMPVIEGYESVPYQPGIHFGMSDDTYHAIPAFSNSGFKTFAASPMMFWAKTPWLNPEYGEMKREQQEKREKDGAEHFEFGHAFECRILEGRDQFYQRFGVALDKRDYPDALVTVADIDEACEKLLGRKAKGKDKAAKFADLKDFDATAQLWEALLSEHKEANADKYLMPARAFRSMEFAARVIELDPELGPVIKNAQPQVVICWYDAETGIPMKMKADALRVRMILDIKTLANRDEMTIDRAVDTEIARRKYAFQAVAYEGGCAAGRQIVRDLGATAVHSVDDASEEEHAARVAWTLKWATHQKRDEFMFLFYMKGWAPIARGVMWQFAGTHSMIARDRIRTERKRFRQFAEQCGTEPWLDIAPVRDLADEDLKNYATEI